MYTRNHMTVSPMLVAQHRPSLPRSIHQMLSLSSICRVRYYQRRCRKRPMCSLEWNIFKVAESSTVRKRQRKRSLTRFNNEHKRRPLHGVLYCLVAINLLPGVNSTLVTVPQNVVTCKHESLQTTEMACKSDEPSPLKWFVRENHSSEKESLYNGYGLLQDAKSYCVVIADEPGKCYLNLTNKPEAAQTYICFEPGSLAEASAELIWLGDLMFNDSSTKDLVNLTCSIEFRGNWAPTMEWKEHSSYGQKVLSGDVTTVPGQRVISALVIALQRSSNYSCTTKFDISGKPQITTATNVPECSDIWASVIEYTNEIKVQSISTTGIICATTITTLLLGLILGLIYLYRRKRKKATETSQGHGHRTRSSHESPVTSQTKLMAAKPLSEQRPAQDRHTECVQ